MLVPAVNEELTIDEFVAWCHEGLRGGRRRGRDPDRRQLERRDPASWPCGRRPGAARPRSAASAGPTSTRSPYIRGRYVIMGDADCTYDFRQLAPFVEAMRDGTEYVMGSRWKGSIEPGAMPALHQYFGTPFTTWILNRLYGSHVHRHPLRHARHHPRRARADGPASRSRGSTPRRWCSSRCGWSCARPRCRSPSSRTARAGSSHHKRSGWFSPFAGRLDQPARDVHLRRRVLPVQAGHRAHAARAAAHAAAVLRRRSPSARSPSACSLHAARRRRSSVSGCRASTSAAWPTCSSTTPADARALATGLPSTRG